MVGVPCCVAAASGAAARPTIPGVDPLRAAVFHEFGGPIGIESVADPACPADGVVVRVAANGLCRSDWHGWQGHDPMVRLPHVPGHELAGTIVAVGDQCANWRTGDRVTTPFVLGCSHCRACRAGQPQVCHEARQPGFSDWGAFADYVAIPRGDANLVAIPENVDSAVAASLGCRFTTALRAIIERGRLQTGEWLAVFGCGGLGLSAVMIAVAAGARVVAVDINSTALAWAESLGAAATFNADRYADLPATIRDLTDGGAHVALDALGSPTTCRQGILALRPQGRHVQAGLLTGDAAEPALPMAQVIGAELEILGTHGMAAHRFPDLLAMVAGGRLQPQRLINKRIALDEVPAALMQLDSNTTPGITVMDNT